MLENLREEGVNETSMVSLRISLESSIDALREKKLDKAINLFFLIGLLPGGAKESELEEIAPKSLGKVK
jgi:hypothetical protein